MLKYIAFTQIIKSVPIFKRVVTHLPLCFPIRTIQSYCLIFNENVWIACDVAIIPLLRITAMSNKTHFMFAKKNNDSVLVLISFI